jgi:hypothetical protein
MAATVATVFRLVAVGGGGTMTPSLVYVDAKNAYSVRNSLYSLVTL